LNDFLLAIVLYLRFVIRLSYDDVAAGERRRDSGFLAKVFSERASTGVQIQAIECLNSSYWVLCISADFAVLGSVSFAFVKFGF
jgi:hypothetical protein